MTTPPASVSARWFDGRHAQGQPVTLWVDGDTLRARPVDPGLDDARRPAGDGADDPARRPARPTTGAWPVRAVEWPERTRHGQRVLQLPDGGSLQADDAGAFDAWAAAHGRTESWVVRAQQSWPRTLGALVLLLLVGAAGYRWGLPAAAERVAAAMPAPVEALIGDRTMAFLDERWFTETQVPAARQQALRQAFADALAQAGEPLSPPPAYRIEFRAGSESLGANALALPGGTIVLTDALVALLHDRDDALLGVIAHEYGHVRLRHGLRSLMQASLLGGLAAVALGDMGGFLAAAPVVLAQLDYSRQFEREADEEAIRILRGAGHSPEALVVFFERVAPRAARGEGRDNRLGIALGSHPHPAERIEAFRRAAAER